MKRPYICRCVNNSRSRLDRPIPASKLILMYYSARVGRVSIAKVKPSN